ncbi:MAG: adenine phosphoribosyltransferase [Verrucomicrobiales bacterium]|nr:adenine phosphoribosyltransferase [Verrucomicrobiae bacterium]
MTETDLQRITAAVRDVPDFPKPGILFKDITPVLADPALFRLVIDEMAALARARKVDKIVGIDARGFIFAGAVCDRIGVGFVPVRKKGKLPWTTESATYDLEYGSAEIQIHRDAILPGERVLLVDDLLATGGTSAAAVDLVRRLHGDIVGAVFFAELSFLPGRAVLAGIDVVSLLRF